MKLAQYKRKRDFSRTPEPSGRGRAASKQKLSFVVQKHAARTLHYDFRLELDGVLKSWAVPKGPSMDPARKALAVEVEDHPLEYGKFEGEIPKGQYGGGTVQIWDSGTWEPLDDPWRGLRKGHLRFTLRGKKLRGSWNLVRMQGHNGHRKNWLLIKRPDEPRVPRKGASPKGTSPKPSAEMPSGIYPQLATWVPHPPDGDDWLHEVKFDGYRLIAYIEHENVRLITRGGKDWTDRFKRIAEELAKLRVQNAIVDGEVVALDKQGRSDFQALQNAIKGTGRGALMFYLFDLLYLDGKDFRDVPQVDRKAELQHLLGGSKPGPHLLYSEHASGNGDAVVNAACKMALEGIISKRADAPYASGRTKNWLKSKCGHHQEFVVIGYSDPEGSREGFGSLLLGYHDASGKLVYAGRVGTGFDQMLLKDLKRRLTALARTEPPTAVPPPPRERRHAHWVGPKLVAEVKFAGWTQDKLLRQASFLGLREDKPASEVVREDRAPSLVKQRVRRHRASSNGEAQVKLTHPDKILFPKEKITKADIAEYYQRIAERMLPHVVDRPLTLVRCPDGLGSPCFYQRHYTNSMPAALEPVVPGSAPGEQYVMMRDAAGLAALVQIGSIEIHGWGSTIRDIERPDVLVFDLDPDPSVTFRKVINAARDMQALLQSIKLRPFVKTTGGKGLHVVVPIEPTVEWDEVKGFCKTMAEELARREPGAYTTNMRKAERRGRIFIDYLRNGRTATAVLPYSVRWRGGAPVAMPLEWAELGRIKSASQFTVANVPQRVARARRDPWAQFDSARVDLRKVV